MVGELSVSLLYSLLNNASTVYTNVELQSCVYLLLHVTVWSPIITLLHAVAFIFLKQTE